MLTIRNNAKKCVTGITILFLLMAYSDSSAQDRDQDRPRVSPNAVVSQTIGTTEVTITYGRPAVRDRIIFGEVVPFDEIWRTGADEATTITFSSDVLLEGVPVDAGTYSLFTIPALDGEWTIILNNIIDQWGAYNYDFAEDEIRVEVEAEEAPFMEQMMFYFDSVGESSGVAVLHWETTRVDFRIQEK